MYLWNKRYTALKDEPFEEFEFRITLNDCIFQKTLRREY